MNPSKVRDFVANTVHVLMLIAAVLGFLVFVGWTLVQFADQASAIYGFCS